MKMTPRNRNILIGAVVVIGLIYLYNRNKKKAEQKQAEQRAKAPSTGTPKQGEVVSGMASYNDAVLFLSALQNKGYLVKIVDDETRKDFIREYQNDISKADHLKVMEILKKPESKWTLEEEYFYKDNFINNVLRLDQ